MKGNKLSAVLVSTLVFMFYCLLIPAHAYIGPGAGITMLGALWGVILAIIFAVGGLIIWPIRILIRRRKGGNTLSEEPSSEE